MEQDVAKVLESETLKWLEKLHSERDSMKGFEKNKKLSSVVRNMDAYIKDAEYFLENNDLVRAFEAVVYAWGILETCRHLGLL